MPGAMDARPAWPAFERTMKTQGVFEALCRAHGLPEPVAEFRFSPPRRWRFDWAWPQYCIALEIEGGIWSRGRHVRGKGFLDDMEKYNRAAIEGWCVLRATPAQLESGMACALVKETIWKNTNAANPHYWPAQGN